MKDKKKKNQELKTPYYLSQPMKPVHGEPMPAEDGADEGLEYVLEIGNID
jgi:hypothetical protein